MANFKPSVLTLALATAGLSIGSFSLPSYAQEIQETKIEQQTTELDATEPEVAEASNQDKTTEEEKGNTLVITGFRGSVLRSLNQKRNSDTVSEHLSADDLGSLPDISIADALTRLPGISAVRTGGQAAEINIRGLSGGFILATLNGREQVSTGGTRSVEFDQYPSELIASGAVYKSQKASLIEGGVAGTVELRTASAIKNNQQHTFNFNLRGMFNDRADEIYDAEENGNRISLSYQGKFADETIGVSFGYARLDQPSVATQFIGLQYPEFTDVDFDLSDTNGPEDCIRCEYISEGMELQHKGGTEVRDGVVAAFEWLPNDDFRFTADAFLSKFESEQFARGFRIKFGGTRANYFNPVIFQNNVVGATVVRDSGSFTRVEIVNDDDSEVDEVRNYGMRGEWNLTDKFFLSADASYSKGTSDFQNRLLWSLVAEDATVANPVFDSNVSINYRLNGLNLPDVGFNQRFDDINNVMVSKYGTYPYLFTDDLKAFKIDGAYDFESDIISSLEFGVRLSERNYDRTRKVFEYGNDGAFSALEPPFRLTNDLAQSVGFSGDFSNFPNYLAVDIDGVLANWLPDGVGQPLTTWGLNSDGSLGRYSWSVLQSGEVFEDVSAAYLMANIDTEIGEHELSGNFGVRVVKTKQRATTLQNVRGDAALGAQNIIDEAGLISDQYAPGIEGIEYTEVLPQFNLNYSLTENSQLRFAAARVMSRPDIERLAADFSGDVVGEYTTVIDPNDPNGTPVQVLTRAEFVGNSTNSPELRPFLADSFDLSYEYYFDKTDGAFIAAVFYKDVKSFIDTFTIQDYDFAGNGWSVPSSFSDPNWIPGSPTGPVVVPVENGALTTAVNNTNGGYIAGAELAYTQVFSMLPGAWKGLGVNMSYSYTDSEVSKITDFGGSTIDLPLEGLSRDVFSGTLFYEYGDFETRVNVRHRSRFVSEQIAVNEQTVFFDKETVVDYQASYQFSPQGSILFQVNNLTDQPTKSYFGTERQTGTIQYFGRQFFLGMTYSL